MYKTLISYIYPDFFIQKYILTNFINTIIFSHFLEVRIIK